MSSPVSQLLSTVKQRDAARALASDSRRSRHSEQLAGCRDTGEVPKVTESARSHQGRQFADGVYCRRRGLLERDGSKHAVIGQQRPVHTNWIAAGSSRD